MQIIKGEDQLSWFESSAGNWRKFCKICGCHLFMTIDAIPEEVYVWVASLDDGAHPEHPADKEAHIFIGSKADWEHVSPDIQQFDSMPDNIGIGQSNEWL
ncbi:MAG: GFA family protein [Chloroflexota bacterium]